MNIEAAMRKLSTKPKTTQDADEQAAENLARLHAHGDTIDARFALVLILVGILAALAYFQP
jgi:hypothetical protein